MSPGAVSSNSVGLRGLIARALSASTDLTNRAAAELRANKTDRRVALRRPARDLHRRSSADLGVDGERGGFDFPSAHFLVAVNDAGLRQASYRESNVCEYLANPSWRALRRAQVRVEGDPGRPPWNVDDGALRLIIIHSRTVRLLRGERAVPSWRQDACRIGVPS